jgi:predicted HTH domain antitoxin
MGELKLHLPPEVSPEEAMVLLAAKLYERGTLSLGQAAEFAGYSRRAFMELLDRYEVPVFDHPPEELAGEIED